MRFLLAAVLLLPAFACGGPATDRAGPNALTPREVTAGWVLLFDGATTFGWEIQGPVELSDGSLVLGGDADACLRPTTAFDECAFEAEWRLEGRAASATWGEGAPVIDLAPAREDGTDWGRLYMTVRERRADAHVQGATGKYKFALQNARRGADTSPDTPMPPTKPTFTVPAGSRLFLRSLKLKPERMKAVPIVSDLPRWKHFADGDERAGTEFSVKDGSLHMKGGLGGLRTEALYDDFVLQLECKSNGDRLRGGALFRCPPASPARATRCGSTAALTTSTPGSTPSRSTTQRRTS
jgi:hypothetical protein